MIRITQFSKNRDIIYDLLSRARKYHATCSSIHEFDISVLMEALEKKRKAGYRLSLNACLIKAASLVIQKYPRFNHHLFHGLTGKYTAEFDEINCNMIIIRRYQNESITLPIILKQSNTLSVETIDRIIQHNLSAPLEDLPQIQGIQRLKRLPRIAMKWFSFKCRSDYRFYQKYFGTFGFSSAIIENQNGVCEERLGVLTQAMANTCIAFIPNAVTSEAVVIDGELTLGKILNLTLLVDHYLVEAQDVLLAMRYLKRLLGNPVLLGLTEPGQRE